jgi:hypothetical protein
VTVSATKVIGATVSSGGSGGVNGACTVTGTTGAGGILFQAAVTITSNAIASVGSISTAGQYTTNPTTLTAEPVTGCSLTGATLSVQMGIAYAVPQAPGSYTATPSNPVSTSAGGTSGATGATLTINAWETTGGFYYGNDDSTGYDAAVAYANTFAAPKKPPRIYFPAGIYYIGSTPTQFAQHIPGGIVGDGPLHSHMVAGANVSGPLVSFSEDWTAGGASPRSYLTYPFYGATQGPIVQGMSFVGDISAANTQHGIVFYDRDDMVTVSDVNIYAFNGSCIQIGVTLNTTQAYVRESNFHNIKCWIAGNSTNPAVLISSTTTSGSDATNEIVFEDLNVFQMRGLGVDIANSGGFSATRLLRFFGLRIEDGWPGYDMLRIGDPALTGAVTSTYIYGLQENTVPVGSSSVRISATSSSYAPSDIHVEGGEVQTGNGYGPWVDYGSNISFRGYLSPRSGAQDLTVGSGVGGNVFVDANGQEQFWVTNVNSSALQYVRYPSVLSSGAPAISANVQANNHTGTFNTGNYPTGTSVVDLQTLRVLATQIANATGSGVLSGQQNTSNATDSVVSGGNANNITNGSFRGSIGGGFGNTVSGQYAVIPGGLNNTAGGTYSQAGGQQSADRSRIATNCYTGGRFSTSGDAQTCFTVLRGTGNSASAIRVTSDASTAGANDCVNLPNNSAYELTIDLVAFDHTTVTKNASWNLITGLMTRGSSAASTAVTVSSLTVPTYSSGVLTGESLAITADTTNGCLNVSYTPPTGNTDTYDVVARVQSVEVL